MYLIFFEAVALEGVGTSRTLVDKLARMFARLDNVFA